METGVCPMSADCVETELDRLNALMRSINLLESQLESAQTGFKTLLRDSTHQLEATAKQVGVGNVNRARLYFQAAAEAARAQQACQLAATHFQRAHSVHLAARETIARAESKFAVGQNSGHEFDSTWQQMLNRATEELMESERQKALSKADHQRRLLAAEEAERRANELASKLKRFITKSQVYFDQKESFHRALEQQKRVVEKVQAEVSSKKAEYKASLKTLERISESIHAARALLVTRDSSVVDSGHQSCDSISLSRNSLTSSNQEPKANLARSLSCPLVNVSPMGNDLD